MASVPICGRSTKTLLSVPQTPLPVSKKTVVIFGRPEVVFPISAGETGNRPPSEVSVLPSPGPESSS